MTMRIEGLRRALWRLLIILPLVVTGPLMVVTALMYHGSRIFYDFKGGLFNAATAILHGHNPYRAGFLAHQAALMHGGHLALGETAGKPFSIPVYPALANVLVTPFGLLPFWAAASIYTILSVAAMLGGIWLLGVRDWRCLALTLISWPFMLGFYLGAIGPFLVLGAGVAWRWRDRIWPPALSVATIVAVKLFPWTLGVWLLVTRRYKALGLTIVVGLVLTFGAWALIDFHGLAQYPGMLSNMSFIQEDRAVSVVGVLVIAGLSAGLANVIAIALALAILALAWRLAGGPDGDRKAFGLVIIAALTGTPIVWDHYMVLLFLPVALVSPRLSWMWLLPLVAPFITFLSWIIISSDPLHQPFSPVTLCSAIPWLLSQAVLAVVLCTTAEQRHHFISRLPRLPRAGLAADPA